MKKIEIDIGLQSVDTTMATPENYTQVTGIYSGQVTPQFLNAPDNVQKPIVDSWERSQPQDESLRFFRIT
jgi:hypothetical protein